MPNPTAGDNATPDINENTGPRNFNTITKVFHWLTVLLIITVIPLGIYAGGLAADLRAPGAVIDGDKIAQAGFWFSLHKTVGIAIFFTALARIAWALARPRPGLLNGDNKPEALIAEVVHWSLYTALIMVPLMGWIHHSAAPGYAPIWWPFGQAIPLIPQSESLAKITAALHVIFERVLVISVFLHVAGALKHHFVDRDSTLRRMLPGTVSARPTPQQPSHITAAAIAFALWGVAVGVGAGLGMFHAHDDHSHSGDSPETTAESAPESAVQSAVQSTTTQTNDAGPQIGDVWAVETGTLAIEVVQFGKAVNGTFTDWSANIQFDDQADQTPMGQVEVRISIASLTLGGVTDQAKGADFLDAAGHPEAVFRGVIERAEQGYVLNGALDLRGQSVPMVLPFALTIDGDVADMRGEIAINRRDFAIGDSVTDEATLAFSVLIKVELQARRAP